MEHTATPRGGSALTRLLRDPAWVDAVLPTILLRGVILVFAVLAVIIIRPDALPSGSLLGLWERWDAPHFFEVARYGYGPPADPARIVIFPLFPAMVAVGSLLAEPLVAGMLIAFGATLASAVGLYRLIRLDANRSIGRLGVLAMSIFPTAFSLVAPYSEAVFLAFAIWAFLFARTGRWREAGVCSLFAGLARIHGAFILPALAVEYWLSRRRIDRDAAWLLLGAGGPLVYLAINALTFGDPLFFVGIQTSVFHVSTTTPWTGVWNAWQNALAVQPTEYWATVYLAPVAGYIVLGLTLVWTLVGKGGRPSYAVYCGLAFLSFAALTWPISVPRYIMGAFPIFIAAAHLGRRPWAGPPLFVASTLLFGICLTLFVTGHWAF
jgi:Gpi18-like mannosyltransferase